MLARPAFYHTVASRRTFPRVGIFTSPLYTPGELARLGMRRLVKGYKLSAMHVLGTSVPDAVLRRGTTTSGLRRIVVQTRTTQDRLIERGVRPTLLKIIAPGVDPAWERPGFMPLALRERLGFAATDAVVVYFGSPAPLRGLHSLIQAVALARQTEPRLKLLILSRRRADELMREDADLAHLLGQSDTQAYAKVVSGFLPEDELVEHVAAADIAALPFEIIPSDAPLSILEAQALAKPIVVTTVGCLRRACRVWTDVHGTTSEPAITGERTSAGSARPRTPQV